MELLKALSAIRARYSIALDERGDADGIEAMTDPRLRSRRTRLSAFELPTPIRHWKRRDRTWFSRRLRSTADSGLVVSDCSLAEERVSPPVALQDAT